MLPAKQIAAVLLRPLRARPAEGRGYQAGGAEEAGGGKEAGSA